MENNAVLLEIIQKLGDVRSKLSALYSLYNSSLLVAEENRSSLPMCYEQLIDKKNDLTSIANAIAEVEKKERQDAYLKYCAKIKHLNVEVEEINKTVEHVCSTYRIALKDCGALKTEYRHEVSELCKAFKVACVEGTPVTIKKGYNQQIKLIKSILEKIDCLVADYNVKKNNMEKNNTSFVELFGSISLLINNLQSVAA
ncbi:MAG: hypothetical protein MJ152_01045 [Clostridia bacterium]|nr:hypothetical protein [Clostridia bacterium]